ncbi:MAG TPA: SHOCT domain-containing protein [Gaiellaceae bacterium]|nr:SHOCT domain-containing protein [Gaiellaceae bacterium]
MRRRRPLAAAAMIGGTAYAANKAGHRSAEAAMQEQDQNAQIAQLQAQQAAMAPPPPPAPAAPAGNDMVTRLKELQTLKDQGVLTDAEFEAAKAKVISG